MRVWVAIASAVVLGLTFAALQAGPSLAHDPTPTPEPPLPDGVPPIPIVYSGTVLVAGSTPPDGLTLTARIEGYEAEPVAIVGGHFRGLTVGVDDSDLLGRLLTFYLNGEVPSDQTVKLVSLGVESLELTFPRLPTPPPTPTPTPAAVPTSTPTPRSALPAVYSGPIVILGGTVSPDAELVARVGGYVSIPAVILENSYLNLVIAPNDMDLLGEEVTFLLDGIEASTTDTYESGKIAQNHTLVFVGVPTPTNTPTPRPTSTPTPVPTSTPTPVPTNTPTPKPTSTPTSVQPTPTPVPTSTPTPVPTSTPTPVPTSTPTPVPTSTPTPVPTKHAHTSAYKHAHTSAYQHAHASAYQHAHAGAYQHAHASADQHAPSCANRLASGASPYGDVGQVRGRIGEHYLRGRGWGRSACRHRRDHLLRGRGPPAEETWGNPLNSAQIGR